MSIRKILNLVPTLLLMFIFAGCGNDGNSNTNGTLSLSAAAPVTAGVVNLSATAAITPVTTGAQIGFTVTQYGFNSTTNKVETVDTYAVSVHTDSTGTAFLSRNFTPSQVMDTTLEVTASIGGLHQTVQILIPKFVPTP